MKCFTALTVLPLVLAGAMDAQVNVPTRYRIFTLIGGNSYQDNVPARGAYLSEPTEIAASQDGSVYFLERDSFVIRKIASDGKLTTVAGNGLGGNPSGDGGSALAAQISPNVQGIITDSRGNLYFSDSNEIRKVDMQGSITSFVPAAIGYNIQALTIDTSDRLYFSTDDNRIMRASPDGTVTDFAAANGPSAIAVDRSGNLFAATADNTILKIDQDGKRAVVAGTGILGFGAEHQLATSSRIGQILGMAISRLGTLYFTERAPNSITLPFSRIRKLDSEGRLITVAGGRGIGITEDGIPATQALTGQLNGLASDPDGNLLVTDFRNHLVERIDSAGTLHILAGLPRSTGDATTLAESVLDLPSGVLGDNKGNVYVSEIWGGRIRKMDASFAVTTVAGNGQFGNFGDGLPGTAASLSLANQIAITSDGSILIADFVDNRIRKLDPAGNMSTFAGTGQAGAGGDGSQARNAQLQNPFGLAVGPAGEVYISEFGGHRIRKVGIDGVILTIAGNGKAGFGGDGGSSLQAQLNGPRSLALDGKGNLFVADGNNRRIRRISPDGTITTIAGNGKNGWTGDGGPATQASMFVPFGVLADGLGSVLFTGANGVFGGYVRRVRADGNIETIAGSVAGLAGDGGYATDAQFNFPDGLAIDSAGRILVADRWNHRVRALVPDGK